VIEKLEVSSGQISLAVVVVTDCLWFQVYHSVYMELYYNFLP